MSAESGYEKLKHRVVSWITEEQMPIVCFYVDKKTGNVHLMSDNLTAHGIQQSEAMLEIEKILANNENPETNLSLVETKSNNESTCSVSEHRCHINDPPRFHFSWELTELKRLEFLRQIPFDFDKMPLELLRMLFQYLDCEDILNARLVSKNWNSVADSLKSWRGLKLPLRCSKTETELNQFLDLPISSKVQEIDLDVLKFQPSDEIIGRLGNLNTIKRLYMDDTRASHISSEKLANLAGKCEGETTLVFQKPVVLGGHRGLKTASVFGHQDAKYTSLNLLGEYADPQIRYDNTDLDDERELTFSKNMKHLSLKSLGYVKTLIRPIFQPMESFPSLTHLSLENIDLDLQLDEHSYEFSNLFRKKIEELSLYNTGLNTIRTKEFFTDLHAEQLSGNHTLRRLSIDLELTDTNDDILAECVRKLEKFRHMPEIYWNGMESPMTPIQFGTILDRIVNDETSVIESLIGIEPKVILDFVQHDEHRMDLFCKAVNKLKGFTCPYPSYREDLDEDFGEKLAHKLFVEMAKKTKLETFDGNEFCMGKIFEYTDAETLVAGLMNVKSVWNHCSSSEPKQESVAKLSQYY